MSFDLLVFDPSSVPRTPREFMNWYDRATDWNDGLDYNDASNCSSELSAWLRDMVTLFPSLQGPDVDHDADVLRYGDYSIGRDFIYATFPWDLADEALETASTLSTKHSVGLFTASGTPGLIRFPDGLEFQAPGPKGTKPWWRFW